MLNNLFYTLEKNLRAPFEVPSKFDESHIILASFPKSGNTWMRFVISNIANLHGNFYQEVNFHNIAQLSPEIRGNRQLLNTKNSIHFPIYLKTHFPYNKNFLPYKKVLLLRKPEDVMYSYLVHLEQERGKIFSTQSNFLRHWRYGIDAWYNFHKTWLHNYDYLIKYEDLLLNPKKTLKEMYEYFSIKLDDEIIEQALELSSKENMRKLLNEKGDPNAKNKNFQFVRNAVKGDGKKKFSKKELEYIYDKTNNLYQNLINQRN